MGNRGDQRQVVCGWAHVYCSGAAGPYMVARLGNVGGVTHEQNIINPAGAVAFAFERACSWTSYVGV